MLQCSYGKKSYCATTVVAKLITNNTSYGFVSSRITCLPQDETTQDSALTLEDGVYPVCVCVCVLIFTPRVCSGGNWLCPASSKKIEISFQHVILISLTTSKHSFNDDSRRVLLASYICNMK